MNLQQLEYFKTLGAVENFTAASKLLSITQPALSKSIAKLEEELQVPLFEKKGRQVKLTKYGHLFLKYATRALAELETGFLEIEKLIQPETGTISIATTSSIGTYFMPNLVSGFMIENPTTHLQFNYDSQEAILQKLLKQEVDFGFLDDLEIARSYTELQMIPVKKEEYVLIVPKHHALAHESEVSLKNLQEEAFISSCKLSQEKFLSLSHQLGYTPKIAINPGEATMVESLVAAGAGIALVTNTPLLNTHLLSVLKIKEHICSRIIYMGWLKESYLSPACKNFKAYVKAQL